MKEEKRNYLFKQANGKHLTLNEWINPKNGTSREENLTLLTEEESGHFIEFDKAQVVRRIYFYDITQHYDGCRINESYGYKPFREANPDLKDCYNGHNAYLKKKFKDWDIKFEEWSKKYHELPIHEQMDIDSWKDNPYGYPSRERIIDDYNVKKNGWAFCQTHIGWYYIVEVDLYDEKLVEYPTRITQEEIDNIQKLAPFTQKWTEFGTNDENGKRRWFDKADLPAKAYKNNTYQAKRYKQKASVLKAMEEK